MTKDQLDIMVNQLLEQTPCSAFVEKKQKTYVEDLINQEENTKSK